MTNFNKPDRLPVALPADPTAMVTQWLSEAGDFAQQRNPNAMTITSVSAAGKPSARIVLCKNFVADPGYLIFYTNYHSRKATEFRTNRNAAALFHWDALGRQIRLEGIVQQSPASESDAYFASRGLGSQLGAWGSDQSSPIASREALVEQLRTRASDLGLVLREGTQIDSSENDQHIDRPPHWGGFRLWLTSVELWVEGADRIHDRAVWSREIEHESDGQIALTAWTSTRIQP